MKARDPIASVLPDIASRMERLATELGSTALREVKHLEPSTVAALQQAFPHRVVEKAKKHPIPRWSPVGNVDVLMYPAKVEEPLIAAELKWCHIDKLYEGIWDLFKMALLSTTGAKTYLLTGAPPQIWASSLGKELFADGVHSPADLCQLRLTWGQKLRAWDDLLWGAHDKCPTDVPSEIRTTVVAAERIRGNGGAYELRAVTVEPIGSTTTPFFGGWPFPRPVDAVRPLDGT